MKRSRQPTTVTTPVKSPPHPDSTGGPSKKTKYLSAQQMQAAFLHVTKPLVTSPPSPPRPTPTTNSTAVAPGNLAPSRSTSPPPPPAPKKPIRPSRLKANAPPKENIPPTPPPSPVSEEAAKILLKIDPLRFTPSALSSNHFEASLLSPQSPDFTHILSYINNSQAHGFRIDLVSILKISRPPSSTSTPASDSILPPPSPKPFTMMLWHGTRPQFVASILYNGFICPSTGNQMFGQGVYFADRISKSSQYCHPSIYCSIPKVGDTGYLFLCEVVLGKIYNAKKSNTAYKSAPTATRYDGSVLTFDSLMCTGAQVPDRKKQEEIEGVTWPFGPTIPNTKFPSYTVNYNEYIVYKPKEMVEIKYLVEVKFS